MLPVTSGEGLTEPKDYTWMNYPWVETRGKFDLSSFYNQFRFRFNDSENLFLRHAPASYVQMGNKSFLQNHALVSPESLDPRLQFFVRNRKPFVELGEPVFVELRLRNISDETVTVYDILDLGDDNLGAGIVQVAITNPKGERRPFIPFIQSCIQPDIKTLNHDGRVYASLNLTMGKFGFPFKEQGCYQIEARYRNLDGRTAVAVTRLWVRAPFKSDDRKSLKELFNARVGRVLYVGGSRNEDVNDEIGDICTYIGSSHPAIYYLTAARFTAYANSFKQLEKLEADTKKIETLPSEPDKVIEHMNPVVAEKDMPKAADTIGHITYRKIVDVYANCAKETNQKPEARRVKNNLLELFRQRKVIPDVLKEIENDVDELR
jgi:hypothetical protein